MDSVKEQLEKYEQQLNRQEQHEHQEVLLAIRTLIKTKHGKDLFSYLFKNLDVGVLPDRAAKDTFLHEHLGFLRAGQSIFKLASEADAETAGSLLALLEKKRYEDTNHRNRIENGLLSTNIHDDREL